MKILPLVILAAALSLLTPGPAVRCAEEAACCSSDTACPVCDACAPPSATVSQVAVRQDLVPDRTMACTLRLEAAGVLSPVLRVAWGGPLDGLLSYRLRGPPA